ncbi:signal peptide peptidase SppA [Hyphomicrobium sp. CS1BSMeth3]|uniref:signal peptide peptidase SppA n=1 Tax=Hyphomicrobium sp. CS1BSMeth3 TaxID=1892844 RepID=UPI00086C2613|nr:signal peptide peptidase SppA [Hyphomicrobium sp. CS1BSMeth3]MBN9266017.1 signal peptide peptidase SppA [Hyphomicrobium sp.]ODT20813.1 MAG: signal peptidase [Hyphomicrobium sp. SCN 65-11]
MSLETEAVLDRRRLRRRASFWRGLAILAVLLAIGAAVGLTADQTSRIGTKQIARVSLEGVITEDRKQLELLRRVADARNVEGLILFINSPGGTTTGGEALYDAIRKVSEKKPVVAQFGTVATSAAYIAGLATDQIVARGNSITGSVGVIFQWAEVTELMSKLGVKMHEVKSGPLKATPSPFQPTDEAGKEVAQNMIADSFQWFAGLVAERRGIDTAAVPGLMQGRIYSGREALSHKLIDRIGGEDEVRRWLEETRGVTKDLRIVDWKPAREPAWGLLGDAAMAMAQWIGGPLGDAATRLMNARVLATLQLDGLVAVWQPLENR